MDPTPLLSKPFKKKGNALYTWGLNDKGQLGVGDKLNKQTPTAVSALKHLNLIEVSCGYCHMLALTIVGDVWSWGDNTYGKRSCY